MDNNKLDKILESLDKVKDDMSDMKITMAANTATLEVHVKRTDLAEESINHLRESFIEELKPIKSHVSFVKGAIWALGISGALIFGLSQMGIFSKLF